MVPQTDIALARRISVVGSTGSGKTYLARELSERLGLPLHELDRLHSEFPRGTVDRDSFAEAVAELVQADEWIIDGHYRNVRHLIWQRCDLVIFLNYSPLVIAGRLLSRFVAKRPAVYRFFKRANLADLPDRDAATPTGNASWSKRISRLRRTIRERREYARLFADTPFQGLNVIELQRPDATRQWLEGVRSFRDVQSTTGAG